MKEIKDKVADYIGKYAMLQAGEQVLCAVSGGADSMCMLEVLRELGYGVVCAHFNHRLRGEESDRDERFVRDYCAEHEIPFHAGAGDVAEHAARNRIGTEEAARELRYAFLEETSGAIGVWKIATAHTAGDNAETILLNMTRGTGIAGLAGVPPVRGGRIIRPMLSVTRGEIEAYMKKNGITNIEDSTNESDEFMRNRIRHRVTPTLLGINPKFETAVLEMGESLREDEEYMSGIARTFLLENSRTGGIPTSKASMLPRSILMRVIREFIPRNLTRRHLESVARLILSGSERGYIDLPGTRVMKEYGVIRTAESKAEAIVETELRDGESMWIPGAEMIVSCVFHEKCADINSSFNIFYFQNDTICGKILVRARMPGDKIKLPGRKTRSLKKMFSEARIPLELRAKTPVIADDSGVIAAYGFGVCERCVARPGDRVIEVAFKETESNPHKEWLVEIIKYGKRHTGGVTDGG